MYYAHIMMLMQWDLTFDPIARAKATKAAVLGQKTTRQREVATRSMLPKFLDVKSRAYMYCKAWSITTFVLMQIKFISKVKFCTHKSFPYTFVYTMLKIGALWTD